MFPVAISAACRKFDYRTISGPMEGVGVGLGVDVDVDVVVAES